MRPPDSHDNLLLGDNIRNVRKLRKISLKQLSTKTDLSTSFLSQLERGMVNVSVDNLRKIAKSLGLRMVDLFEVKAEQRLGAVTHRGEGMVLEVEGAATYCESLIRQGRANIQATLYRNPPGEGRRFPSSHSGEEFVYVVEGEVIYTLHDQEYHLREGDSMYYRSEAPHSWYNPGGRESVMVIFNTPPYW
ncbi:MAG: cupin domain-containing protein [Thermodesulfobacteriota bacterium]